MNSALYQEWITENPLLDQRGGVGQRFTRRLKDRSTIVYGISFSVLLMLIIWNAGHWLKHWEIFTIVVEYVELIAITFAIPASAATVIAGEREQKTWEALILTRLTPQQIIAASVVSRAAFAAGILAVFLPEIGLTFAEASGRQAAVTVTGQVLLFCWAVVLTAFGLLVSANTRSAVTSRAVTYGSIFTVLIVIPTLVGIFAFALGISGMGRSMSHFPQVTLNPFDLLWMMSVPPGSIYSSRMAAQGLSAGLLAAFIYLVCTGVFLYATYRSLKRLEEPKRRSG